MSRFLICDLWAPLGSWGTLAVGDIRPGQAHPTRSAVLGLLAGALGHTRDDQAAHDALAQGLGLAVLVSQRGDPLEDFHTVEVPRQKAKAHYSTRATELAALDDKDNPVVSRRHYVQDAFYTLAIWRAPGSAAPELERLRQALGRPVFVPSLGRKSCPPGLPLLAQVVEADTLLAALEAFARQRPPLAHALQRPHRRGEPPSQELFWDHLDAGPVDIGREPEEIFTRRDQPLDRLRWLFGQRQEARASLDPTWEG